MKKYSKTFKINKIKVNFPYYVSDIVDKLGITKGTVYAWVREGLKPNDNTAPYIFHGSVLREFLKKRQQSRKHPCEINEMFCLKCQRPRRPLEGKASLQPRKVGNPNLTGKCSVCNSQMFKSVSHKNLPEVIKTFKSEEAQASHLIELPTTTTNHNKNRGE
jgi:hypothetical protein